MPSSPALAPSRVAPLRLTASNRRDIAIMASHANCGGQAPLARWYGSAKPSISLLYGLAAGTDRPTTPSAASTYTPSAAGPAAWRYRGEASAAVIISGIPVPAAAHWRVIATGGGPVAHTSRRSGFASWVLAIRGPRSVWVASNVSSATTV